ncbi:uncharacterized protein LOC105426368 [Pogonomyrmex barbatus]|uniref:Uncharacterized protein LOC105426368 n=1 Tax=Pogonomyrmex barbatus TaxID=144034 RepID=A0A6I9W2D5_9HYME|nr:uncharacterized protein LOC105426368 [Pogonomyrmex barbatus]
MDNVSDVYYLVQLIVRQIWIFLQDFIFREFTWFASTEENLDNADSKIRAMPQQHPIADLFVFLAICGLLFAFMILSVNSPKNEASDDTSNIETISMTLEEDPSSFWYQRTTRSSLISCHHACGDSIGPSHNVVPKIQNISSPIISNTRISAPSLDPPQQKIIDQSTSSPSCDFNPSSSNLCNNTNDNFNGIADEIARLFKSNLGNAFLFHEINSLSSYLNPLASRISRARLSYVKHTRKTQTGRVSQTTPRDWLIRRTRSGHVYGKYPIFRRSGNA